MKNESEKKIRLRKNVLPQMFDVKPVSQSGDLDLEKINRSRRILKLEPKPEKKYVPREIGEVFYDVKSPDIASLEGERFRRMIEKEREREKRNRVFHLNISSEDSQNIRNVRVEYAKSAIDEKWEAEPEEELQYHPVRGINLPPKKVETFEFSEGFFQEFEKENSLTENYFASCPDEKETETNLFFAEESAPKKKKGKKKRKPGLFKKFKKKTNRKWKNVSQSWQDFSQEAFDVPKIVSARRPWLGFAVASLLIFMFVGGAGFFYQGLKLKNFSLIKGKEAYASLASAKDGIKGQDFQKASLDFEKAYQVFSEISKEIDGWGGAIVEISRYIPYASQLSSGSNLVEAGKDISQVGVLSGEFLKTLDTLKNPLKSDDSVSYLNIYRDSENQIRQIYELLKDAQTHLDKINIDDIPEEQRDKIALLKTQLPEVNDLLGGFLDEGQIFTDILGGNGPRKYLFLFQNNQEIRPTGGFIGSYGVLDIFDGRIRNFFVDGIFNPDGQLREKVVPPGPIQKVSAAWSLHDSNWFPDFPMSAEKAIWFYEKTGGPTVDGVITMTPTVMQRLLEITGPIEMPEYDVTVDKDNFVEKIQYEVEVDYDKEENKPKKILADLAPKIMDRIFNAKSFSDMAKMMKILAESLNEKDILIYSRNYDIQKTLKDLGWTGEVLETQKDYLSVINTNINGFKTDGVVDEKIEHRCEIQRDGSIIDTVRITRHHNGGNTPYDWWNRVNADYMRVYVPKGSQFISVTGQTREMDSSPLDYTALGFKRDAQVKMEEDAMRVDEESGTRIYEDAGKTVFGNWTYVSPQETMEITYKYLLPFKIDLDSPEKGGGTYSVLFQKQSGSLGSELVSEVRFPKGLDLIWNYPDNLEEIKPDSLPEGQKGVRMTTDLKTDKFVGLAVTRTVSKN